MQVLEREKGRALLGQGFDQPPHRVEKRLPHLNGLVDAQADEEGKEVDHVGDLVRRKESRQHRSDLGPRRLRHIRFQHSCQVLDVLDRSLIARLV